ncbi:hypothetical protein CMMCAS08_02810 [Clavibacter michiganensis subsp. michiganensis]|uniref:hypothetical protein n=2 Tax=Clavibacter michiganensis TaxID=28447 RepID=UPI000B69C942|nr:hypothetical protein [Clavibacter michiganensis]MDO4127915.1 hypothetical protein [Clavibacter michiganensis]OUD98895.1 hypothetical protein CMMCAS06_11930 [Clavibacter michiganensis subsp. michiganensis]OUE05687.1 hypothetical protein CMMCAS08_02810 [Clavibacter michiganensis subsp. michiganensis]OUE22033.1 hypothetical protein CMMCA001_09125 [Clavibacter michiganensis subsp. michiganensis]
MNPAVQTFSHLLLQQTRATELILNNISSQNGPYSRLGTQAESDLSNRENVPLEDLMRAQQDIVLTALAAVDHLSAFASRLLGGAMGGWALGSLARGCAEAYGRAWFLLEAESGLDLFLRFMPLRIKSASYLAGEEYREYEADWAEVAKDHMNKWSAALGQFETADNKITPISPPNLAKRLLRIDFGVRANSWYASMAAMSHSESTAIDRMANISIHGDHALVMCSNGLRFDLEQFLFQPLTVQAKVLIRLFEYFGVPESDARVWREKTVGLQKFANGQWHAGT